MIARCHIAVGALVGAVLSSGAMAADETWDERLARAFSVRLREIQEEIAACEQPLGRLPRIPIDDQGGTGGFFATHLHAVPPASETYAVDVSWAAEAEIDMIALVPTRRYDAGGLDAQYGMPDAFTVELTDAGGKVVARVADERAARSSPVRKGHPFAWRIDPPVKAAGLRVSATKLLKDDDRDELFVHAWAEAFAFSGLRNVALGAKVSSRGGQMPTAPWLWSPDFLVDGQTPLGLPEEPAEDHRNVGWLSNGRENARDAVSLVVDLGSVRETDGIRLMPARRPTTDLPSGFGFPRKLSLAVSETGAEGSWSVLAERDYRNPGHSPVEISFGKAKARHVRVEAVELWKELETYPAFFALSEVEVLSGNDNLAIGKVVRSADSMANIIGPGGRYWSTAALSDGHGPDGKLVPAREWLLRLDERLRLETRRHALRTERVALIARWRGWALLVFALLGTAGAFAIVALPIRYRIHARRELEKVRDRIAGDLHDEVGSNLGSIQMFADLAEGRSGPSDELKRIQRIAAETVSAVRDIVWLLRPGGDHRIATVEHLRETSSIMLESLDWRFHANEPAWQVELSEEQTRHLFLFFRESLHNILRHAKAASVGIDVRHEGKTFVITIADDGVGIAPAKLERPATLRALRQRASALHAELKVDTANGTKLTLTVPMDHRRRPKRPTAPKIS
jgi:signal transduction histidine kinase